jgi:hypothetical protein
MRKSMQVSIAGLVCLASATSALAQSQWYGTPGPTMGHRAEIGGHGGYVWTDGQDVLLPLGGIGTVDIDDSAMWGITVDINVRSGAQAELLFNRQDSKVTLQGLGGKSTLTDVAVEYWHGGVVYGRSVHPKAMPFTSMTLGATRIDFKDIPRDDDWEFSMIFGLGVKVYAHEKVGLRFQGRLPITFTSGYVGVSCGGGCSPSVGGTGVTQFDLSAGAFLML